VLLEQQSTQLALPRSRSRQLGVLVSFPLLLQSLEKEVIVLERVIPPCTLRRALRIGQRDEDTIEKLEGERRLLIRRSGRLEHADRAKEGVKLGLGSCGLVVPLVATHGPTTTFEDVPIPAAGAIADRHRPAVLARKSAVGITEVFDIVRPRELAWSWLRRRQGGATAGCVRANELKCCRAAVAVESIVEEVDSQRSTCNLDGDLAQLPSDASVGCLLKCDHRQLS
jgi:hypothetical protein